MERKKQAHNQDRICGGEEPPKVDLLDPKSGLFEPQPSYKKTNKQTNKNIFGTLCGQKWPFWQIWGGGRTPSGYGPGKKCIMGSLDIFLDYCGTLRNAL